MTFLARLRFAFATILLGLFVGLMIDLAQQRGGPDFDPLQFVRRPVSVQTRDDAALLSGWLDQIDNSWEVGKNHQRVRSAFKTVVADARKATVRVLRDDQQVAMGTIVDKAGYILTKASEVAGRDKLVCQLHDRRVRPAQLVGTLPLHDLAMLKIQAERLTPVNWYTKAPPEVGTILATPGLGREPLAVGVVSLALQEVANNGVLGIRLRNSEGGPFVTDVFIESAAEHAGVLEGDVVLQVDTQPIESSDALVHVISRRLPGEAVELRVRRGDADLTLRATLGRATDLDPESSNFQSFLGGELSFRRTGFQSVLQHDTFLLPEHCGGPLVDLEGHVIGINIARAERIASYALPAAAIVPWLEGLKSGSYDSLVVGKQAAPRDATETR